MLSQTSCMHTRSLPLDSSPIKLASKQTTNDQLEVVVPGIIGVVGVGSRFEADDSLSLFQVHSVGLAITTSNPGLSCL